MAWLLLLLLDDAKEIKMYFTDMAPFFLGMKNSAGTRKNQLLAYQPVTALGQRRACQKNLNVNKTNGQR